MLRSHVIRSVAAVLVLASLAGCDVVDIGTGLPSGWRGWVVTVVNRSPRPATLFVAQDEGLMGRVVGTATPGVVPAHATIDVTFGIPPGRAWAIFVNPGPTMGPLVTAVDVPLDAAGQMPFRIIINADGSPGAEMPGPGRPGWFGGP